MLKFLIHVWDKYLDVALLLLCGSMELIPHKQTVLYLVLYVAIGLGPAVSIPQTPSKPNSAMDHTTSTSLTLHLPAGWHIVQVQ